MGMEFSGDQFGGPHRTDPSRNFLTLNDYKLKDRNGKTLEQVWEERRLAAPRNLTTKSLECTPQLTSMMELESTGRQMQMVLVIGAQKTGKTELIAKLKLQQCTCECLHLVFVV